MAEKHASRARDIFDAYGVLTEAWDGDNIHLGLFEAPDEPFAAGAERATERLAAAAALSAGEEVLETACGIGGAARYLARTRGVRVTATNIAEAQLELGRERTERAGLADLVRFEPADFQELPSRDRSFDCYWCQEAWLYAADKDAVVREAFRILRPGGRLVVTEFVLVRPIPEDFERELLAAVGTTGFWTSAQYEAAFADSGFADVRVEDWSEHGVPSWERVVGALAAGRRGFEERLGAELVEMTATRFELWLRAFRAGNLGWVFFSARRP